MYERYIYWLPLARSQVRTWPTTQACALTRKWPFSLGGDAQPTEPHQSGPNTPSLPQSSCEDIHMFWLGLTLLYSYRRGGTLQVPHHLASVLGSRWAIGSSYIEPILWLKYSLITKTQRINNLPKISQQEMADRQLHHKRKSMVSGTSETCINIDVKLLPLWKSDICHRVWP